MKFRTALLGGIALLVIAIVVATVGGVATVLQRSAHHDLREELSRARTVFVEQKAFRESLHRVEARVVAEEPRLKAVVATEEITHETVLSVAIELKKALQSDLFLITDGEGHLLADVAEPAASGQSLKDQPLVAGALEAGEKSGILTSGGKAYEVEARRLAFGTTTVGVLLVGYRLDDKIAETVAKLTGAGVVVLLDGQAIAASGLEGDRAATARALGDVRSAVVEPTELLVEDTRYLATADELVGATGPVLRYAVLRSLDRALEPARNVARVLYTIAAIALVGAFVLAYLLSERLSRPLDGLVAFMQKVGAGKLDERATITGPVEIRSVSLAMNRMVAELEVSRRDLVAKERLEREMEISARIQTSILPRRAELSGMEVAARMLPASEVGGDYYDVFGAPGGGWIGIGDVAGHGLTSGLIMLMIQSSIAALGRSRPDATPKELLGTLNRVLYDNIRHRLANNEHVTLTLLRYDESGRICYAGAHEEMVLLRATKEECDYVPTPGTWLGAMADIKNAMEDSELSLLKGDVLVLYTDGVTEAMNDEGEQFGIERLAAVVQRERKASCQAMLDAIFEDVTRWGPQTDDISVVVLRYEGLPEISKSESASRAR